MTDEKKFKQKAAPFDDGPPKVPASAWSTNPPVSAQPGLLDAAKAKIAWLDRRAEVAARRGDDHERQLTALAARVEELEKKLAALEGAAKLGRVEVPSKEALEVAANQLEYEAVELDEADRRLGVTTKTSAHYAAVAAFLRAIVEVVQ